jgi:hypothetical protein
MTHLAATKLFFKLRTATVTSFWDQKYGCLKDKNWSPFLSYEPHLHDRLHAWKSQLAS